MDNQLSVKESEGFDAVETSAIVETSSAAVAAQAQAAVQARYVMAIKRPRNMDQARIDILRECDRTSFAEIAWYSKPVGGGQVARGPSIRFVEAAIRALKNIIAETMVVYDDNQKRIIKVSVTDLENNVTWPKEITIAKTVERKNPKGREVLSKRTNTQGETTYTVACTDDELATKENANVSKAIRVLGARLIPGDIIEEALQRVTATLHKTDKVDPTAAKKKLIDAFSTIGVTPENLAQYVGHDLSILQPSELATLREIHAAIKDGEATWKDYQTPGGEQFEPGPKLDKKAAILDAAKESK